MVLAGSAIGATSSCELGCALSRSVMKKWSPRCSAEYSTCVSASIRKSDCGLMLGIKHGDRLHRHFNAGSASTQRNEGSRLMLGKRDLTRGMQVSPVHLVLARPDDGPLARRSVGVQEARLRGHGGACASTHRQP